MLTDTIEYDFKENTWQNMIPTKSINFHNH